MASNSNTSITSNTTGSNPSASDDEKSHTFRKRRLSLSRHKVGADCLTEPSTMESTTDEAAPPSPTAAAAAAGEAAEQKAQTFRKRRLSLTLKSPKAKGEDQEQDDNDSSSAPPPEDKEGEVVNANANKRPRRASDASAASGSSIGDGLRVRTLHAGEILTTTSRCPPSPVPDFTSMASTAASTSIKQPHVLYRTSRAPNSMSLLEQAQLLEPKWKKRIVRKHDEDERKLPFPRDIVGTYSCHGVEPVYDSDYEPIEDLDDDEDEWTEDISGGGGGAGKGTIEVAPRPITATNTTNHNLNEPKPTTAAKINQDRGGVAFPYGNCPKTALFAAYDGHGQGGELVSQFALHEVQSRLEKRPEFNTDLEKAFKDTFLQVDEALREEPLIDPLYAGTTACVALLRETTLTCANAGDSRAVIARRISSENDEAIQYQAIDLTIDQNPDLPEERQRIEARGGFVSPPPEPGLSARVWLDEGFSQIGLAMARSIGDHAVAQVGVIADPVVSSHQVLPEDEFLIIATDGVWEFLSSEAAVEIVGANLARGATKATQALIEAAAARWHDEEGDYRDDITALVVRLPELWKERSDAAAVAAETVAQSSAPSSDKPAQP